MAAIQPEEDAVFITSATAVCVRERMHSPKRFVYEVQVQWSNSHGTTCYRGYTDFFDFQCELLTTYPMEAGSVKGTERTLPYLPGRKVFQRRTLALAEQRLPQIDQYVKDLIDMPEHISRSEKVLQFFRSNWQEDRLRRGSFTGRNSSSSSSAALLFSEDGNVEYSVRKLSDSGVFREASPTSDEEGSKVIHSITEVEEEEEKDTDGVHFEAPSTQNGPPRPNSTVGTTM